MKIRNLRKDDLQSIDRIYRQYHENDFSLPSLGNTVTSAVVESANGIVGFGVVKVLAEAMMVLDMEESKSWRLEALQLLMDEAIRACHERGIEQLHVFVKNPSLVRLLSQKYGFTIIDDTTMVRSI